MCALHESMADAYCLVQNFDNDVKEDFWNAFYTAIECGNLNPVVFADAYTNIIYNFDYYVRNHNFDRFCNFLNTQQIAFIFSFMYSYKY